MCQRSGLPGIFDKLLRELQGIHRPENFGAGGCNSGALFRSAGKYFFPPLRGDCFNAMHGPKKSAANGGIGVGVAAAHDRVNNAFFKVWGMERLLKRTRLYLVQDFARSINAVIGYFFSVQRSLYCTLLPIIGPMSYLRARSSQSHRICSY